jgi:hypothetical protein
MQSELVLRRSRLFRFNLKTALFGLLQEEPLLDFLRMLSGKWMKMTKFGSEQIVRQFRQERLFLVS